MSRNTAPWMLALLIMLLSAEAVLAAPKATKEEFDALFLRVERIERVLDEQAQNTGDKADKEGLIALQRQLKAMERELQALRDENERLQNQVEQMQQRQREAIIALNKRAQEQEQQQEQKNSVASNPPATNVVESKPEQVAKVEVAEPVNATPPKPVKLPGNTVDSQETTDAYREAFLLLKQRRYDESITGFENFLTDYPNSKYSANAQYWLAEANYVSKRYDIALEQFQTVIDQYPTSSKVPDARLKIGYTYYELQRWEDARVTLTRLRSQFPNSTVAGLAQQRLERLDREGH